ncbi:MAG: ORF6N domain-containing protein [Bacteroidales bacterium]|nr:ORF6N domain-containing protein [Bacteroidales bacterium]
MSEEIIIKANTDIEVIKYRIYEVRGLRVMLDRDLAELYNVETRALNQAVRRNIDRFPEDLMFVMTDDEMNAWKSQIVMSNSIRMGMRRPPVVFTELGIAMLSSVLRSETAIQVNINIMRAFVTIRHAIGAWQDTNLKVEQLSHKVDSLNARVDEILHEQNENNMEMAVQIEAINNALDQLREKPSTPRKRIGFKQDNK